MILEEVKQQIKHLQDTLNDVSKNDNIEGLYNLLDHKYIEQLNELFDRFAYWKPEAYIYIEKGLIESIHANCNLEINLWDNDIEKMDDDPETIGCGMRYKDRLIEWTETIKQLLDRNEITKVFE